MSLPLPAWKLQKLKRELTLIKLKEYISNQKLGEVGMNCHITKFQELKHLHDLV